MNIHAIILALNEEDFITECIKPLYEHCSGISVVTQFDRNWYSKSVVADTTVNRVLKFEDPHGKISLVVRRHIDEAIARNEEMVSITARRNHVRRVRPHAATYSKLLEFYAPPDYFLIVDADEIFDEATLPSIVEFLAMCRPQVMHLYGYEYARSWNERVVPEHFMNIRVGFVKPGILFSQRRVLSYTQIRLQSLAAKLGIPSKTALKLIRHAICPPEVGVFHHGALIKPLDALASRAENHSEKDDFGTANKYRELRLQKTEFIPSQHLPINIQNGSWPAGFIKF